MTERSIEPIDEQQWQKIAVAIPPLVTVTIGFGRSVFGWHFGDAQSAATVEEVSAVLSLIGIVFYGAASTAHSAVDRYVANAWRMGTRGGGIPASGRFGALDAVAPPTRRQVKDWSEKQSAAAS